jgi:hypothetical protein
MKANRIKWDDSMMNNCLFIGMSGLIERYNYPNYAVVSNAVSEKNQIDSYYSIDNTEYDADSTYHNVDNVDCSTDNTSELTKLEGSMEGSKKDTYLQVEHDDDDDDVVVVDDFDVDSDDVDIYVDDIDIYSDGYDADNGDTAYYSEITATKVTCTAQLVTSEISGKSDMPLELNVDSKDNFDSQSLTESITVESNIFDSNIKDTQQADNQAVVETHTTNNNAENTSIVGYETETQVDANLESNYNTEFDTEFEIEAPHISEVTLGYQKTNTIQVGIDISQGITDHEFSRYNVTIGKQKNRYGYF